MIESKEAIYKTLAARMVSDEDFMDQLKTNPRETIEKALNYAKIEPTEKELDDLVSEYHNFVKDIHHTSAKEYLDGDFEPAVG